MIIKCVVPWGVSGMLENYNSGDISDFAFALINTSAHSLQHRYEKGSNVTSIIRGDFLEHWQYDIITAQEQEMHLFGEGRKNRVWGKYVHPVGEE